MNLITRLYVCHMHQPIRILYFLQLQSVETTLPLPVEFYRHQTGQKPIQLTLTVNGSLNFLTINRWLKSLAVRNLME